MSALMSSRISNAACAWKPKHVCTEFKLYAQEPLLLMSLFMIMGPKAVKSLPDYICLVKGLNEQTSQVTRVKFGAEADILFG